jgi:hypothetical protein
LSNADFVSKYAKSEPFETPASLAIAEVAAAVSPREAMTRVAAARIALRRSQLRGLDMPLIYKSHWFPWGTP